MQAQRPPSPKKGLSRIRFVGFLMLFLTDVPQGSIYVLSFVAAWLSFLRSLLHLVPPEAKDLCVTRAVGRN